MPPSPPTPQNEKIQNLAKIFVADWHDQNSMYPHPLHPWKDVDGTRMEHKYEQAMNGTRTHDRMI